MESPPIVSAQEWETAGDALFFQEKELTRARDALAAQRRRMPRLAVEKDFDADFAAALSDARAAQRGARGM